MSEINDKKAIEKRRNLTDGFLGSEFYRHILEPHLKKEIETYNKISKINGESPQSILNDYRKNKNKVDIYRGLLNKFQEWASKSYKGGK